MKILSFIADAMLFCSSLVVIVLGELRPRLWAKKIPSQGLQQEELDSQSPQ